MSDTAISPGVGSIVVTGLDPHQSRVVEPTTGAIVATGNTPSMNLTLPMEAGSIAVTGQVPDGYMWGSVSAATTTWTVVPI